MTLLEDKLGRRLLESEIGAVDTLNDLSSEQLATARRLARAHRAAATDYLERVVRRCDFGDAAPFVNDVLLGDAEAATWGVADVLHCPRYTLCEVLAQPASIVLGSLDAIEGERWWRRRPRLASWWAEFPSPGVVVRGTRYWQRHEMPWQYDIVLDASDRSDLEPVRDPAIELRRSTASRAVWAVRLAPIPADVDALARALGVPVGAAALSRDGHLALAGLLAELERGLTPADWTNCRWLEEMRANPEALPPGYRAPDEAFGPDLAA